MNHQTDHNPSTKTPQQTAGILQQDEAIVVPYAGNAREAQVMRLQRTLGNRQTQQVLGRTAPDSTGDSFIVQRDDTPSADPGSGRGSPSLLSFPPRRPGTIPSLLDPSALAALFAPSPESYGPYTISRVENSGDNERIVHISTGHRYRVKRIRVRQEHRGSRPPEGTSASPGISHEKVWMTVQWCADSNEGEVTTGVEVPPAVVGRIVGAAISGSGMDEALRAAEATPYVEGSQQVGRFTFSVRAATTVSGEGAPEVSGSAGVTIDTPIGQLELRGGASGSVGDPRSVGGTGSVGLSTDTRYGRFGVGVEGEYRPGESGSPADTRVGLSFRYSLPGGSSSRSRCSTTDRVTITELTRYECYEITTDGDKMVTGGIPRDIQQAAFPTAATTH